MKAGFCCLVPCFVAESVVCIMLLLKLSLLFADSADNTRSALHFANAALRVTMRPQQNEVDQSNAVIRSMKAEIDQLKRMLVSCLLLSLRFTPDWAVVETCVCLLGACLLVRAGSTSEGRIPKDPLTLCREIL